MNIIELAKEADKEKYFNIKNKALKTFLERFADLIRAETLEEAAKVCEEHPDGLNMLGGAFVTCAAAIRGLK